MFKHRREAAQGVADRLIAAEFAIDAALVKTAELTGYMLEARARANLAACVGQEALEQAAKTSISLVAARRTIIEAHKELASTKDAIGLRTLALGGLAEKGDGSVPHLTVVGQTAA